MFFPYSYTSRNWLQVVGIYSQSRDPLGPFRRKVDGASEIVGSIKAKYGASNGSIVFGAKDDGLDGKEDITSENTIPET